jgi:hypothetical protein
MSTFNETEHPRATTGVFTDKAQSAPETTLSRAHLEFGPGDELPNLGQNSVVRIDGETAYRVGYPFSRSDWITGDGREVTTEGAHVTVGPEDVFEGERSVMYQPAAALVAGDLLYDTEDDPEPSGTVVSVYRCRTSIEEVTVTFTDPAGEKRTLVVPPGGELMARRPANPYRYDAEHGSYWDNVRGVYSEETTAADLDVIVSTEAEDDFMLAVISNRNATAAHIEKASQHGSFTVRRAAVFDPRTSAETLRRIEAEALAASTAEGRLRKEEGISPNTSYRDAAIRSSDSLARAARQQLNRR